MILFRVCKEGKLSAQADCNKGDDTPPRKGKEVEPSHPPVQELDSAPAEGGLRMGKDELPCLFVGKEAVGGDPALKPGARGARKLFVPNLFEKKEVEATEPVWAPPAAGGKCQVVVAASWEMAFFNQNADQDRHHHGRGTEVYMVLTGTMKIIVGDEVFTLHEGDTIVVNPGAVHEVLREGTFLTQVICVDCGGAADKFVD